MGTIKHAIKQKVILPSLDNIAIKENSWIAKLAAKKLHASKAAIVIGNNSSA